MSEQTVGVVSGGAPDIEFARVLGDICDKYAVGVITLAELKRVAKREQPFVSLLEDLQRRTRRIAKELSRRFNKKIEVDPLPAAFTEELLAKAAAFNLKPVFLPGEVITPDYPRKGWVKPSKWFFSNVDSGAIKAWPQQNDIPANQLQAGWYLADFTDATDYTDGTQVFTNDPLASIITRLRSEKKIGKYEKTPAGSRFAITHNEWREILCPVIAQELGLEQSQVRPERYIEFNAIGNLYDSNRGSFNTWEWFADYYGEAYRLCGGNRDNGGLSYCNYNWPGSRDDCFCARPLVSFV